MRLTIIGASGEAVHTIECARRLGIETLAIDGDPKAEGLRYADIPVVTDISDIDRTVEVVREFGTDWVQTVPIGRYLITTGAVNDALGLPGITRQMAELCTDKYAFHKALNENGLRECRCLLVRNGCVANEVEKTGSLQNITYPVILKPRYGSGSRGIMTAQNETECMEALEALTDVNEDYILEECLQGTEYGIDGAVIDGEFKLTLIRYKYNTPLPHRQAVGYAAIEREYKGLRDIYADIYGYMKRVAAAMGLDECLLHADVLDTDRGLFAIEVSARPSGHDLHDVFTPMCTGVDIAYEYMKHRMGLQCDFEQRLIRPLMIHYFDYEGEVVDVPHEQTVSDAVECPGVRLLKWKCDIEKGQYLESVTNGHSLMSRGYYITESPEVSREYVWKTVKECFVIR